MQALRPQNQAEAQLLATESRWNIPEKKMAQILGLTNSQGHGDWTMFGNFLTALMRAHLRYNHNGIRTSSS